MKTSEQDHLKKLLLASSFASKKHSTQRRKDHEASPYINHPIAVATCLAAEGGVTDVDVLCAAILHDTIEDTDTSPAELSYNFGEAVCSMVQEVTDDKALPKAERKRLQIAHAPHMSFGAKLIKLGDKICNLRDVLSSPPDWPLHRKEEYFDWAAQVVEGCRVVNEQLEAAFDAVYLERDQLRVQPARETVH